ncbi:sel1 repeat family protein [Vibrio sp. JPW-9-11-11]|uniref:tetratricopeptide repeat protein n=1 Tax=Vibrio sp. JPW-9-11-11 TaxID=1416532 RepID=UPI001592B9ED|nr:tetratricopeptide repeat protein [Vibrio sp. JPW-9-11-11]NVD08810.1 sel1 repeat family protein [Vibrio sp. JPW-9-11-11]
MNIIGIAIGATGLLLLCMFMWMLALSLRKKRIDQERKEREIAFRKALEKNRQQEQEDRVQKAEQGHIPTILYLAKEAERARLKEALYWYTKAAKLDSVTGMYGVVRLSNKMKQDLVLKEQAKFWQTAIAALEGSLPQMYEMALALFNGRGTEVNVTKAIEIMESAAEQSYVDAIIFLGDWWISPNNSNKNPTKSSEYYHHAATLKSNEGRMKLGLNYIKGVGVPFDFERGCYWIERAAEKGHLEAMYRAGETWMEQRPNGNAIAYIWLFLAAQLGYEPARNLRDQVALNIGVDTVVGLQSLAKPIIKKIRERKVSKHSIIKALNRLYKRQIPIDENSRATSVESLNSTAEVEEVATVPPAEVMDELLEEAETQPESGQSGERLDFSQSPIDKH